MRIWLAAFVLLLAACGEGPSESSASEPKGPGRWFLAALDGLEDPTGVAVAGEGLLVVSGSGSARVHALPRPEPAARLAARAVSVEVDRDARLSGGEAFTAQGYRIGDLWDRADGFTGVAVQDPDHVFLLEPLFRIVYAGRLVAGRDGLPEAIRIQRAFTVPGADRARSDASDWSDVGPGVRGLASVQGKRLDDLFVLERGAQSAPTFRVRSLDRYGAQLAWFDVRISNPGEVVGLAHEGSRFLVFHGTGRGLLTPFREGRWREQVKAGPPVPGPELEDGGSWQGLATASDGRLYVVGGGPDARIAWRE